MKKLIYYPIWIQEPFGSSRNVAGGNGQGNGPPAEGGIRRGPVNSHGRGPPAGGENRGKHDSTYTNQGAPSVKGTKQSRGGKGGKLNRGQKQGKNQGVGKKVRSQNNGQKGRRGQQQPEALKQP